MAGMVGRVRAMSGRGAAGPWQMWAAAPTVPLRGDVQVYTGFVDETIGARFVRAGPVVSLFVAGGSPLHVRPAGPDRLVSGSGLGSFLAGPRDTAVVTEHEGRHYGVGLHLSLTGAYRLLGVPGGDLANNVHELPDLLGPDAARLEEQLLTDRATPAERFAVVDRYLAARLADAREPAPEVAWVYRRLSARPDARVADLAREVGWSRTRLATRFRRQLGLGPKRFARVVRFTQARKLAEHTRRPLSQIAYECGFADQAHLTREFTELDGQTPQGHRLAHHAGALPEP